MWYKYTNNKLESFVSPYDLEEVFDKSRLNSTKCIVIYLEDDFNRKLVELLSSTANGTKNYRLDANNRPLPIIFWGVQDFFYTTEKRNSPDNLNTNKQPLSSAEKEYLWKKLEIPDYYNWLDFSIWNYYLYLGKPNRTERFKEILEQIEQNYKKGLYKAQVAHEYIDFNTKLCLNSEADVDKNEAGHFKYISPFVFHSESRMQKNASKIIETKLEEKESLRWDFLLVDDFAEEPLSGINNNGIIKSKKEIIESVIQDAHNMIDITSVCKKNTQQDSSENSNIIWQALETLAYKSYDIILLDYLLGKADNKYEDREYSHELLIILHNIFKNKRGYGGTGDDRNAEPTYDKILKYHPGFYEEIGYQEKEKLINKVKEVVEGIKKHKGPLNKLWIMNISSFHIAFLDRLREQGLGYNNRNWTLSRGADPVNTPHLFAYNLFRFMNLQIDEANINTQEMINQFFDELNELGTSLQDWASSYYQVFITRFGKFHILKQDRNKSEFSRTFYQYLIKEKSGDLETYERFRNFLFLLANGTKQDLGQLMRSLNELSKIIEFGDSYKKEENHNMMSKLKQQIIKEFPQ